MTLDDILAERLKDFYLRQMKVQADSGRKKEKMALKSYQLFSMPGMDSDAICVTDDDWDENDEKHIEAGYSHVEWLTLADAEELEARLHNAMLGLAA